MTVYVDQSKIKYRRMLMGHMIADSLDELHDMAKAIGLRRSWFQSQASFPHYDVCLQKRRIAVSLGAVECDRRTFVNHMRRLRGG